jgi:signal recognition particle subunit SRP54
MGPIGNILGMLPGAGQMKDALAQVDDKQLDRLQAIIRGMTPAERADPKIINGSRRLRIANGSGVAVSEVNDVVNRFFEARKMMKQMAGQFGFGTRSATKKQAKGRKGKKGKAKGRGPTQARAAGLPPGLGAGMPDLSGLPPSLRELPPGLDQLPPGFDPSKFKFPKEK